MYNIGTCVPGSSFSIRLRYNYSLYVPKQEEDGDEGGQVEAGRVCG